MLKKIISIICILVLAACSSSNSNNSSQSLHVHLDEIDTLTISNTVSGRISISLAEAPESDAKIRIYSEDDIVFENGLKENYITFTPQDWNIPKSVNIYPQSKIIENSEFVIVIDNAYYYHQDTTQEDRKNTIKGLFVKDLTVSIAYNPYNITPLSAEITLTHDTPVTFCYEILDTNGNVNIRKDYDDLSVSHLKALMGLYPNFENTVIISAFNEGGVKIYSQEYKIDTLVSSENLNNIQIIKKSSDMQKGWTAYTHNGYSSGVYDSSGTTRWLITEKFDDGFIFVDNNTKFVGVDNATYTLTRLSLAGNVEKTCPLDFLGFHYHHDLIQLPNGNYLLGANWNPNQYPFIEDHLVEVDLDSCSIIKVWDLSQKLDINRQTYNPSSNDWFHNNSVFYNKDDNSILLSGRHQGVIKIDYETGDVLWILSPHKGWVEPWKSLLLTAVNADGIPYENSIQDGDRAGDDGFDWNWGQHTASIANGKVVMFDNGDNRWFQGTNSSSYSRIVEYEVIGNKVKQVREYGKDRLDMFSQFISVGRILPNGNRLMHSGNGITAIPYHPYVSMIELNDNDEIVFESKIMDKTWIYRQERVDFFDYYAEFE